MAAGKDHARWSGADQDSEGRPLLHARSSASLPSPSGALPRPRPLSYGAAASTVTDHDGVDDDDAIRISPSDLDSGISSSSPRRKKTWGGKLQGKGDIVRLVPVIMLWSVSRNAPIAAASDSNRSYSCGAYYEKYPDLIDAPDMDRLHPCAAKPIESSTAQLLLATSVLEVLGSALSILLFSPKLSKWGRKPVLLISLLSPILVNAPYLFLPHSYPYGPVAAGLAISPSLSRWIVLAFTFFGGVLGSDSLFLCAMRCSLIDLSSPASRSKLLILLMICVMVGVALGPLIAGLASTYFPIDAQHLVHDLSSVVMLWKKHPAATPKEPSISLPRPSQPPNGGTPDLPIPGLPLPPHRHHRAPHAPSKPVGQSHNNVTPFLVSLSFATLAFLVCWFTTPETLREKEMGAGQEEEEDEDHKSKPKKSQFLSALQLLLPVRSLDGRRDWRLARLLLSQICILLGASATNTIIVYVGGPLDWSPSQVGYLLSWLATSRSIAMLFVVPILITLLEKLPGLRPTSLLHFSVDTLKSIAKLAKPNEVPGGESTFVDPREFGKRALVPIVTLWRANIDLTLARFSFAIEVIGWLVISLGATFSKFNPHPIFLGISLLAFGGGGMPSLQGAGVTLTTDVLTYSSSASQRRSNPTDVYMSISSFLESTVVLVGLFVFTGVYDVGLGRMESLPFLGAACCYAMGCFWISTIRVHRTAVGGGRSEGEGEGEGA